MGNTEKTNRVSKTERAKRLQFTDWLYRQYEVSFLPKYFFMNLDKVYKGTYKNLTKPVPVDDLWDMWQRKMPYLLKVYDRNKRIGKTMEGVARINYDLAIVLSRYDSYLAWKDQQMQALAQNDNTSQSIDYKKIASLPTEKNSEVNINEIIEEI